MTAAQTVLTLVVVAGIAGGQILFKLAADSLSADGLTGAVRELVLSPHFIGALALYGTLTGVWLFVLHQAPLTRAYPFFALSFVFVPVLSALFLSESMSVATIVGAALIVAGIAVVTAHATG